MRLTEEMTLIKSEISSIGTFNAQKKKEDVLQKLNAWIPLYNSFQAQLEPFKRQIKETQDDNRYLHEKVERQSWNIQHYKVNADNLQRQPWEYEEFIESIPEDYRKQLQQRFERLHEQEQALEIEQW